MKRFSRIAVFFVMLLAAIGVFTACGSNVDEISIESGNMPQVTFVLGQELDLSAGKLTVKHSNDDPDEQIALDDEGVTVTGYDKNQLGKQELTIEYGGKTTKLTVTVVERIVAEGYTTDYFVGETLNTSSGTLKITRDNGTTFSVRLSDETVTLGAVDNTSAGKKSVDVTYQSGSVSYSGTISVTFHAVATDGVKFNRPTKTSYKSHETTPDVTGGYITLTSADGAMEPRYVQMTADMITGFNPGLATVANRTNPLEQVLTVTYAGANYNYTIYVTFSDVSYFKLVAEDALKLDWTQDELPEINAALGEKATEVMGLFFKMSYSETSLISNEELGSVVRASAVYGYAKWLEAVGEFSDTFTFVEGVLSMNPKSYESAKRDYARLIDEKEDIFVIGDLLTSLASAFEPDLLYGDVTVGDYLAALFSPSDLSFVSDRLEYMIALYESLQRVPENWNVISVGQYRSDLEKAISLLRNSPYTSLNDRALYNMTSKWRAKDDFFEILYTYYFNQDDATAINVMKNKHLPGPLEDLYSDIRIAMNLVYGMQYGQIIDSSMFMLYYEQIMMTAEEIVTGEDEMYYTLYYYLTFDGLLSSNGQSISVSFGTLLSYLRNTTGGYLYHANALLGKEEYYELWGQYLVILESLSEEYLASEQFGQDVELMFNTFVNMSPSMQIGFLRSMNVYYTQGIPALALDYFTNGAYTYFVYFLANYYESQLPEDACPVFRSLMLAMETYAMQYETNGALSAFKIYMEEAIEAYGKLSSQDKADFDGYLDFLYQKYLTLYNGLGDTEGPDLGDWAAKFDELTDAIREVNMAYMFIVSYNLPVFEALLGAYEAAEIIAQEILDSENEAVIWAYYYQTYPVFSNVNWTMDYAMFVMRNYYVSVLRTVTIPVSSSAYYYLLDVYTDGVADFLGKASPMMMQFLYSLLDKDTVLDGQCVKDAMAALRELNPSDLYLFYLLDYQCSQLYYQALESYFTEVLTDEDALAAAKALLVVERAYIIYSSYPNAEVEEGKTTLDQFKTCYEDFLALYNKLEGDALKAFEDVLKDTFDAYAEKYQAVTTPQD